MAGLLFTNNASAALASSITTSSTTITVTTGSGALFPAISGGNYFYATLTDSSNNLEIVKVTARATDVMTVVRAQEGTTARAYAAADKIELRVTAAGMNSFPQLGLDNTFTGINTFSGSSTFSGAVALSGTTTAVTQSSGDNTTKVATTQFVTTGLQAAYPVGSIYMSTVATNPGTLFGFGTWVAYGAGRMPISVDGTYTAGSTGGSATTTLATTNLPSHTHSFSATTGGTSVSMNHQHYIGSQDSTANQGGDPSQEFVRNYDAGSGPRGYSNFVDLAHTHDVSGTTGGTGSGTAVTTISPYIAVYMWNRTA